ncbi:MAG: hypothetical protein DRJ35_03030 [Thermoprotei archaeon]|nr:MAG: hypothetical protein DRJ35_03030 [Thermoprotei archaeon]
MEFSTRIDYIHAERITEEITSHTNINVQISIPSAQPKITETEIIIPFSLTVTSTPPTYEIIIKGKTKIKGMRRELEHLKESLRRKKPHHTILQTITSTVLFEAALLARELGYPPLIPLPTKSGSNPPMGIQPV